MSTEEPNTESNIISENLTNNNNTDNNQPQLPSNIIIENNNNQEQSSNLLFSDSFLSTFTSSKKLADKKQKISELISFLRENPTYLQLNLLKEINLEIFYEILVLNLVENNNSFALLNIELIELLTEQLYSDKFKNFYKKALPKLFDKFYLQNDKINSTLQKLLIDAISKNILSMEDFYPYIEGLITEEEIGYKYVVMDFLEKEINLNEKITLGEFSPGCVNVFVQFAKDGNDDLGKMAGKILKILNYREKILKYGKVEKIENEKSEIDNIENQDIYENFVNNENFLNEINELGKIGDINNEDIKNIKLENYEKIEYLEKNDTKNNNDNNNDNNIENIKDDNPLNNEINDSFKNPLLSELNKEKNNNNNDNNIVNNNFNDNLNDNLPINKTNENVYHNNENNIKFNTEIVNENDEKEKHNKCFKSRIFRKRKLGVIQNSKKENEHNNIIETEQIPIRKSLNDYDEFSNNLINSPNTITGKETKINDLNKINGRNKDFIFESSSQPENLNILIENESKSKNDILQLQEEITKLKAENKKYTQIIQLKKEMKKHNYIAEQEKINENVELNQDIENNKETEFSNNEEKISQIDDKNNDKNEEKENQNNNEDSSNEKEKNEKKNKSSKNKEDTKFETLLPFLGNEITESLSSQKWEIKKLGFELLNSLLQKNPSFINANNNQIILFDYIKDKLKNFKESNFNIIREAIDVFITLIKSRKISKDILLTIIESYYEKITDPKLKENVIELIYSSFDIMEPGVIIKNLINKISKKNNAKLLQEYAVLFGKIIDDFDINTLPVKEIINYCKVMANNSNQQVRQSATGLLCIVYKYIGDDLKILIKDIKESTLKKIEAELEKVTVIERKSHEKTRKKKSKTAREGSIKIGRISNSESILNKPVDISNKLTYQLLNDLSEGKWQQKKEAFENLLKILETANMRILPNGLNDLFNIIITKLSDCNKNYVKLLISLISKLIECLKKDFKQYSKQIALNLIPNLSDSNQIIRNECQLCFDKWVELCGIETLVIYFPQFLKVENTELRLEIMKFIKKYHNSFPKALAGNFYKELINSLLLCLQDKTSNVRNCAEEIIILSLDYININNYYKKIKDFKPTITNALEIILNKIKEKCVIDNENEGEEKEKEKENNEDNKDKNLNNNDKNIKENKKDSTKNNNKHNKIRFNNSKEKNVKNIKYEQKSKSNIIDIIENDDQDEINNTNLHVLENSTGSFISVKENKRFKKHLKKNKSVKKLKIRPQNTLKQNHSVNKQKTFTNLKLNLLEGNNDIENQIKTIENRNSAANTTSNFHPIEKENKFIPKKEKKNAITKSETKKSIRKNSSAEKKKLKKNTSIPINLFKKTKIFNLNVKLQQNKNKRYELDKKYKYNLETQSNEDRIKLKEISKIIFTEECAKNIFSNDFKKQVEILKEMKSDLDKNQNINLYIENIDIILKIIGTIMLGNQNTTLIKYFFDFLDSLYHSILKENIYNLTDIEMNIIMTLLVEKMSLNNNVLKEHLHKLLIEYIDIFDNKDKLALFMLNNSLNKNNKIKSSVLELIYELYSDEKINICLKNYIKVLSKFLNSNDTILKTICISIFNEIYYTLGDELWLNRDIKDKEREILQKNLFRESFEPDLDEEVKVNNENNNEEQIENKNEKKNIDDNNIEIDNNNIKNENNIEINNNIKNENNIEINNNNIKNDNNIEINNNNIKNDNNIKENKKTNLYIKTEGDTMLDNAIKDNEEPIDLKHISPTNKPRKITKSTKNVHEMNDLEEDVESKDDNNNDNNEEKEDIINSNIIKPTIINNDNNNNLKSDFSYNSHDIYNNDIQTVNDTLTEKKLLDILYDLLLQDESEKLNSIIIVHEMLCTKYEENKFILIPNIDNIIKIFMKITQNLFNDLETLPLKFGKYLITILCKLAANKELITHISYKILLDLINELLSYLLINGLDKIGKNQEGNIIFKSLNSTMLRLIENCEATSVILSFLEIIKAKQLIKNQGNVINLAIKCLIKTTQNLASIINNIQLDKIFLQMHLILINFDKQTKAEKQVQSNLMIIRFIKNFVVDTVLIKGEEILKEYKKYVGNHQYKDKYIIVWIKNILETNLNTNLNTYSDNSILKIIGNNNNVIKKFASPKRGIFDKKLGNSRKKSTNNKYVNDNNDMESNVISNSALNINNNNVNNLNLSGSMQKSRKSTKQNSVKLTNSKSIGDLKKFKNIKTKYNKYNK